MKHLIGAMLLAVAGMVMADQGSHDLLLQSDALAKKESVFLQSVNQAGYRNFRRGEFVRALQHYDYAAWHGSRAAALRLCVMDAYGIGTAPNALKAAFWCDRAGAAGGADLAGVRAYLENYWLAAK